MLLRITTLTALTAVVVIVVSCKKAPDDMPPSPSHGFQENTETPRVPAIPPAQGNLLSILHHAAQEMALDGFQYDKPDHGWPYDVRSTSSAGYLELLAKNGYIDRNARDKLDGLLISNLSDSDPGETAFFRIEKNRKIQIVRKDGTQQTFTDQSMADTFAPPPPRNPSWLP
jgi:hypothetical protein